MKKLVQLFKFVAFAGIVAAAISYFNQYARFNKKAEEDFHELEDRHTEDIFVEDEAVSHATESNENKKELANAAKKLADAGMDVFHAGSAVLKDTYENLKENPKVNSLLNKATQVVSGKRAGIQEDTANPVNEMEQDIPLVQEDTKEE